MGNAKDTAEKRVLIVDDSKFVRTTFNRILSSSFSVIEAVEGDAAWKTIQADASIVMVFTDLDMPKLDGYGLMRLVRGSTDERIKKLPMIVIKRTFQQILGGAPFIISSPPLPLKHKSSPEIRRALPLPHRHLRRAQGGRWP